MKKILLSPWTALITLFIVIAIKISNPNFVESVKLRYFDTLITSQTPVENNIVTVNIDEAALDKWGQWPFKRDIYAGIIGDLYKKNAGLVVWNVMMPEPDRQGGDSILADTMKKYPTVLSNTPSLKNKNIPRNPGSAVINAKYIDSIIAYPGIIANIPDLENSAIGVGTINTLPEIDGVNRRLPLIVTANGKLYPNLSLETLRVLAGDNTVQIKLSEIGVDKMRIPKFGPISTDPLGRIWIDWKQNNQRYSVTNVPLNLNGAIVIVGTTAAGISNPVPTAKGAVWPQDLQAAVLGTMINKVNIQRPDWAEGAELAAIVIGGLLLLFLTRWVCVGLSAVIIFVVAGIGGSIYAFSSNLYLFDATAFSIAIILVALHAYGVKFVSEFLQKQQIKKQFGTYLSPDLVARLQKNPELLRLGGESKELTILFSDVRGFTSISEHYGSDVQGLTKIMNRYMTAMTAKILENEGTLDKYIGDAQMAFWNAPLDDADHAKNAVKTALQMLGSLDEFNKEVQAEGIPPFGMGLGINTGTVVVGNMGSAQRFDYTCLGDSVNLASRLEGQSKPYHVAMVIGPKTNEYVRDEYFTLPLDCIAVKGKKDGVNIFTVITAPNEAARSKHNHMMDDYRAQRFAGAIIACKELMGAFGGQMDGYYDMWIERCQDYIKNPPGADWDGVFKTNTK